MGNARSIRWRWRGGVGALAAACLFTALAAGRLGDPWAAAQDGGDAAATATRAAEATELAALRTEVVELRARVAELTTSQTVAMVGPLSTETPIPIACGKPVTNFNGGAATANGITLDILQARPNAPVTPPPVADAQAFAVEVTIENRTDAPLRLGREDFRLTTCDGRSYAVITGGPAPAIADGEVAPGDRLQGWITFALPDDDRPARFDFHLDGGGRLGQRLTTEGGGAAGASASGEPAQGCDGAPGADAVGADATGGDGADGGDAVGGDAVGGDATGGDGADGGDAVGGDAVGGDATGGDGADGGDAVAECDNDD